MGIEIVAGNYEKKPTTFEANLWTEPRLKIISKVSIFDPEFVYIDLKKDIERIEIQTEESVKKLSGTVGWAIAGSLIAGPLGFLIGGIFGGRGKKVCFAAYLKNGKKFLAVSDGGTFEKIRAATFFNESEAPQNIAPKVEVEKEIASPVEQPRAIDGSEKNDTKSTAINRQCVICGKSFVSSKKACAKCLSEYFGEKSEEPTSEPLQSNSASENLSEDDSTPSHLPTVEPPAVEQSEPSKAEKSPAEEKKTDNSVVGVGCVVIFLIAIIAIFSSNHGSNSTPAGADHSTKSTEFVTDDKGNTMSVSEVEAKLNEIQRAIENESDEYKKSYLQGVERALREEWERAKRKSGH